MSANTNYVGEKFGKNDMQDNYSMINDRNAILNINKIKTNKSLLFNNKYLKKIKLTVI